MQNSHYGGWPFGGAPQVATVIDDDYEAGTHTLHWEGRLSDGESVASGIYFAKLTAGSHTATRKMMVVK